MFRSIQKESQKDQKESVQRFVHDTLNKLHPVALLEWIVQYSPIN